MCGHLSRKALVQWKQLYLGNSACEFMYVMMSAIVLQGVSSNVYAMF